MARTKQPSRPQRHREQQQQRAYRAALKRKAELALVENYVKKLAQQSKRHSKKRSVDDIAQSSTNKQKKLASDSDNETITSETNFSDLPQNIWLGIFKYLGHGDLLTSRLVSKTWNSTIMNFQNFPATKMVYLIKPGVDIDSQVILKKSTAPWKRLRMENFSFVMDIERVPEKLPPMLISTVKSLEFVQWNLSWDRYCETIIQFPALEELHIVRGLIKQTKSKTHVQFQTRLLDTMENLTSVSLEVQNITGMTFYINQLNLLDVSKLVSISLIEVKLVKVNSNYGFKQDTPEKAKRASELLTAVLTLIKNSSTTLKSLRMNFQFKQVVDNLFPKVVAKISGLVDLHSFCVESISISDTNKMERDLEIFTRFIQSQKNLKEEICLPRTKDAKPRSCSWNELLEAINENMKQIHVPSSRYMQQDDFFDNFSQLKHLSYEFKLERILKESAKEFYFNMQSLQIKDDSDVQLMVLKFPNLTKLTLDINVNTGESKVNNYSLFDSGLQAIIQNLKKLQYLFLGNWYKITDFGVSGVKTDYCEQVFNSRGLLVADWDKVPKDKIDGCPISSLTGLTHLTLNGSNSFSDVGIFLGFGFKELRQLRIMNMCIWQRHANGYMYRDDNVTSKALEKLAKLNPDLDSVYLELMREIRPIDMACVTSHLRRIVDKNFFLVQGDRYIYRDVERYGHCCMRH